MQEIYPSIWIFEKQFSNPGEICNSIEKVIDDNLTLNWTWAQTSKQNASENIQDFHRTNQVFSISSNVNIEELKKIDDIIFNITTSCVNQYSVHYGLGPMDDEGYSILKYENGTMYKQHHDCGPMHSNRVVSMLAYLNDDFVGGELEFPYIGIKYKPSAGDVVLFPSNYTFSHIAHPVSEGTKYAVVSWLGHARA